MTLQSAAPVAIPATVCPIDNAEAPMLNPVPTTPSACRSSDLGYSATDSFSL